MSIESVMPSNQLILYCLLLLPPSIIASIRVFSLLELVQTHVHWVGDAIQPTHPLLSPSPPTFNHSQHQGLFQRVSFSHQVAKVLEFQLQHQSFNEHSGLISFRMDWLDLLAVQGTLKSLLQHHSSKASILWYSAFFIPCRWSPPWVSEAVPFARIIWQDGGSVPIRQWLHL